MLHLCAFLKKWYKNPRWSFSCCLSLILPFLSLSGDIDRLVGENMMNKQVDTGDIEMPSVLSLLLYKRVGLLILLSIIVNSLPHSCKLEKRENTLLRSSHRLMRLLKLVLKKINKKMGAKRKSKACNLSHGQIVGESKVLLFPSTHNTGHQSVIEKPKQR